MSRGGIHYNYLSITESHVLQNNVVYPEEIFIVLYVTFMFAVKNHGPFWLCRPIRGKPDKWMCYKAERMMRMKVTKDTHSILLIVIRQVF